MTIGMEDVAEREEDDDADDHDDDVVGPAGGRGRGAEIAARLAAMRA